MTPDNNNNNKSIVDMMNERKTAATESSILIIDTSTTTAAAAAALPSSKATTISASNVSSATTTTATATTTTEEIVFPSMPSALVGSIIGVRSESGTMVNLKGTGSFDATAQHTNQMGRLRALTAPSILTAEESLTTSSSPPTVSTFTSGKDDIHIYPTNNNTSMNQTTSFAQDDENDEEIKMAMAMALAIQSNPHLTPHEIHELLGNTQQQQQRGAKSTATATASSLLSSFTTSTAAAKPSRFTQMFSNFTTTATSTSSTTTTPTNSNNSTNDNTVASLDPTMTRTGTSTTAATTTTTNTTSLLPSIEERSDSLSISVPTITSAAIATTTTTPSSSDVPPTKATVLPTATSNPNPPPITVSAPTTTDSNDDPSSGNSSKVVVPVATTGSHNIKVKTENTIPTNSSSNNNNNQPTIVAISTTTSTPTAAAYATNHHPTVSPSFTKQISHRSAMLFKSASLRNNNGGSNPNVGSTPQQHVRISGIAWKRRGGMGKYSTSHAWERRRIELVGTKLLYYIIDEQNENYGDDTTSNHNTAVDPLGVVDPLTTAGNTSTRKSTWLESTGINFTSSISLSAATVESGVNKEPRGFLDLAKEKASVHAAFGHSGAPTPFALSIKVRAETKWKLCFDRHSIEMDWLAAISDVVIQCSVDAYNGYLLEAADPANHSDFTLFHPPMIKDGPAVSKPVMTTTTSTAIMGSSTQHQLWMLEDYHITNSTGIKDVTNDEAYPTLPYTDGDSTLSDKSNARNVSSRGTDDDLRIVQSSNIGGDNAGTKDTTNGEVVSTNVYEAITTVIDHDMIQDTILNESNQHWVVPEEKLPYILLFVNLAMIYTRASTTTPSGFWSIFVCANFGILLCFVKEPRWQSLVDLIKNTPTTTTRKSSSSLATKVAGPGVLVPEPIAKVGGTAISSKNDLLSATAASSVTSTSGYMPVAGCTTVHLKDPSDIPKNAKGEMFAGWCSVPGEILAVRSHGYAVTKKKVPSPGELYECIHLEVFESPERYPDMAKRVQLPKVEFDDDARLKTWRCPDLFIISIALPTDAPRMGKTSSDGGGYTITMYYRMKQETREILRRVTADGYDPSSEIVSEDDIQTNKVNAVRLLEEWVRRAPTDHKFQSRFKIVPNAHNLKEIGMPAWISKYNGKPFLIKRPGVTGFLFAHPELSCVEFDVSLHPFPYLAKQAICFMKESYFKKVLVSFGFVIEGRADDELPECLIGLVQLCYPDPQYAIQASEFFNGTALQSF